MGWATPQVAKWDLYSSSLTILWQRKHSKVFISVRTFLFLICLGVFFHSQGFKLVVCLFNVSFTGLIEQMELDGTLAMCFLLVHGSIVPVAHAS